MSKSGTVLHEGGFFLSGSVRSGAVKSDTFQVNLILWWRLHWCKKHPSENKCGISGGSYSKPDWKETCDFPQRGSGSSAGTAFPLSPVQQLQNVTAETLGLLLAGEVQTHLTRLWMNTGEEKVWWEGAAFLNATFLMVCWRLSRWSLDMFTT